MQLSATLRSLDLRQFGIALAYYLAGELGYWLTFDGYDPLPFWPPAGVAFALLVLFGRNAWPGIAIGSLLIGFKSFWISSADSAQVIILVSFVITSSRVAEALIGDWLLRALVKQPFPFSTVRHAFYFIVITFLISVISAFGKVLALTGAAILPTEVWVSNFFTFWLRNVIGILVFASLILSIPRIRSVRFTWFKAIELATLTGVVALVTGLFSLEPMKAIAPDAMPLLAIPVLLWLSFRFDVFTAVLGNTLVALAAIFTCIYSSDSFFLSDSVADSILLLQLYIGIIAGSSLVLASAVCERQRAQQDLKEFNENLENLVHERTKALEQEILQRKHMQDRLQVSNEELSKRNAELDNFVYSVSHDLRAPMASILGLINLAKKDKQDPVNHLYLDMMEKSARQQDHFISEILDQSRNSRLDVKREEIQLKPLIQEAFDQLTYAGNPEQSVERDIHVNQSEPFYGDPWRLRMILNNLISNSIRYRNGRKPVIRVNASVKQGHLNLTVEDNGKGISAKHLSNLGKMFYRATDEGAGSGLGLYIVKETLQKLHGNMSIESEEGKWTRVHLDIPEVDGANRFGAQTP